MRMNFSFDLPQRSFVVSIWVVLQRGVQTVVLFDSCCTHYQFVDRFARRLQFSWAVRSRSTKPGEFGYLPRPLQRGLCSYA